MFQIYIQVSAAVMKTHINPENLRLLVMVTEERAVRRLVYIHRIPRFGIHPFQISERIGIVGRFQFDAERANNRLWCARCPLSGVDTAHPKLHYIAEWWKQLYGESEGKDGKGIFPASVDLTTDLHSMGQWIQDGERTIFETVISVEEPNHKVVVPTDEANLDGLNFLAGKRVDEVNKMAELGTQLAHVDGGVPNLKITMPEVSPYYIGQLFYFFERACGISGYMLGVNPFDQPGVEAYKKNMFALLNKPGYEKESEAIRARL